MEQQEILLETGTNEFEMLEFFINEESDNQTGVERNYFGMNVAKVMEVIEAPDLDPNSYSINPCFLGTIPLRDLILPVIDLSVWLGIKRAREKHENIIVTRFSDTIQGFLVSGVVEIHRLNWTQLIPPGVFIQLVQTKSIIGMVDTNDHFIQLLDLEHIVSDLNPEATEEKWKTSVVASREYRALVADDSPTIRLILKKNLVKSNFNLKIVNNGEEAQSYLWQLREQALAENKPISAYLDVVICDIEMPLLDGFTLTKRIKENSELKALPVILYSSIISDELRHKGESVKADYQISKPDMNKMAETAIRLIESQQTVF